MCSLSEAASPDAGIAREAALRGWKVGLIEQEDFGFGTSSRSSKIIHGGIRYLEYGQLLLVRESARERKVLRKIAPHLVHPIPFLYPAFGEDRLWLIRTGLAVFDRLASASADERHRNLGPAEVRAPVTGPTRPAQGRCTLSGVHNRRRPPDHGKRALSRPARRLGREPRSLPAWCRREAEWWVPK